MMNINKLISEYLIHSFLYYEKSSPIISDKNYDKITIELKNNWEIVINSNHPHKNLLDHDSISSSTGFTLKGKYPTIVKLCAYDMKKEYDNNSNININDLF